MRQNEKWRSLDRSISPEPPKERKLAIKLDTQDKAALRKLDDDFVISADGETAAVTGEMQITAVRPRR